MMVMMMVWSHSRRREIIQLNLLYQKGAGHGSDIQSTHKSMEIELTCSQSSRSKSSAWNQKKKIAEYIQRSNSVLKRRNDFTKQRKRKRKKEWKEWRMEIKKMESWNARGWCDAECVLLYRPHTHAHTPSLSHLWKKGKNTLDQHWIAPRLQWRLGSEMKVETGKDRDRKEGQKRQREERERLRCKTSWDQQSVELIWAGSGREIRWYSAMELLSFNPSNVPGDTHQITTEPSVHSYTLRQRNTTRPPSDTPSPPLIQGCKRNRGRRQTIKPCGWGALRVLSSIVFKWSDTVYVVHPYMPLCFLPDFLQFQHKQHTWTKADNDLNNSSLLILPVIHAAHGLARPTRTSTFIFFPCMFSAMLLRCLPYSVHKINYKIN